MSLCTRVVSGLIFPLHERLKRHQSVRLRRSLERSQWLTPEQIKEIQDQNLSAFIERIYGNSPYYRRLMQTEQLRPEDIRSVADLPKLPFLTKDKIREQMDRIRSRTAGPLKRFATGGSTGEPLVFYLGKERVSHDVAAKWRATRWWHVDIGDREAVVWGSPVELDAQDRLRQWRDGLLRSRLLPGFEMSAQHLDRMVAEIVRFRPAMLFGYPSSLALIAKRAERQGTDMTRLGIRVAFVTSEQLFADQQTVIERVFGCPTANGYGGRDAGFVAHQCPAGGMHISAEHVVLEIVGRDGKSLEPGESGEVVVTHTATAEFPFVRYRTGDIAVLDDRQCGCGRGLPLLREIQGRTTDFVVDAKGTIMHGLALIYVLRDLPGIDAFKIIQESPEWTRVLVVAKSGLALAAEQMIVNGLRKRLGGGVKVEVQCVTDIPREPSGKFRYVVSKVPVW